MEDVRPLEHRFRLRRELRVRDLDRALLDRYPRRLHENLPREVVVFRHLERGGWSIRLRPQRLVEDRVTVVERVEQPIGSLVALPEVPVVRSLEVELLVRRRPLRL